MKATALHRSASDSGGSVLIVPKPFCLAFLFDSRQGKSSSLLHSVHTSSGAHSASYPMGTGALSPGVKRPGREADHSVPSRAEAKKGETTPSPPYVFVA
jgi:hypothetical protein